MAVLIACEVAGAGGALAAVTAVLVLLTGELRARWDAKRIKAGRKPDRRQVRR